MSCYRPLQAWNIAPDGERKDLVFSLAKALEHGSPRPVPIPCGQCIGCRLDYSREWANRCLLEASYHESNYFATITYDDAHLPRSFSCDPETGEVIAPCAALCKRDFQLFMKRLRKNTGQKIRFFAAGEYGTNSFRPHYHVLLFGLQLDDLTPYKKSPQGYPYFNSPTLDKCWTDDEGNSKGFIVVGRLTWETCAYTARYIMKKQRGPEAAEAYAVLGLTPEFSLMSRRPGIARQYYDDHPEIWQYDLINLSTSQGGKMMPHPLYFRRLFEIDDPLTARELSEVRRLKAVRKNSQKMCLTDKDYCDMLLAEEDAHLSRIKALKRNLI